MLRTCPLQQTKTTFIVFYEGLKVFYELLVCYFAVKHFKRLGVVESKQEKRVLRHWVAHLRMTVNKVRESVAPLKIKLGSCVSSFM